MAHLKTTFLEMRIMGDTEGTLVDSNQENYCRLSEDPRITIAKIPKPTVGENVVQLELSFVIRGNKEWFNHFGRQFGKFLRKVNFAMLC